MILREIQDTSIAICLVRCFFRWHRHLGQKVSFIYHNSHTHDCLNEFWKKIKVCFQYSFLGKISTIKGSHNAVLHNSHSVQSLINLYKQYRAKAAQYSEDSISQNIAKETEEQFISSPVKIISIILVTIILVNAVLTVILQKQIDLWGFLIQVLFLFAGAAGLSCEADWPTVKETSVFLKKLCKD